MNVDVILQRNSVYIGMEDVSVTYVDAERLKNVTAEKAAEYVKEKAKAFLESEQYKKAQENAAQGRKSYYPTQWDEPCRAIVCEAGKLNNIIHNYNDLYNAKRNLGAREYHFADAPKYGKDLEDQLDVLYLGIESDFADRTTFASIVGHQADFNFLNALRYNGKITAAHIDGVEVEVPVGYEKITLDVSYLHDEDDRKLVGVIGVKKDGVTTWLDGNAFYCGDDKVDEILQDLIDNYDFDHDENYKKEVKDSKREVEEFMKEEEECPMR